MTLYLTSICKDSYMKTNKQGLLWILPKNNIHWNMSTFVLNPIVLQSQFFSDLLELVGEETFTIEIEWYETVECCSFFFIDVSSNLLTWLAKKPTNHFT